MAWWGLWVALNGGVLALTRTLARDFVGSLRWRQPRWRLCLVLGWLFHIGSLLTALGKLWAYTLPESCLKCFPVYISECCKECSWIAVAVYPWAKWWPLSAFSYLTFVGGLACLWLFASRNVLPESRLWWPGRQSRRTQN